MSLGFIIGQSGSGKTQLCYEQIIEESLKNPKEPLILLVPEQFTLQTQKDIVRRHPNNGIMAIEVLSFQRLAYRVFDEVGGTTRKVLEETGKSMVIRKVIEECKKELKLFNKDMDKMGVIQEIKSSITEFFQYNLTDQELDAMKGALKDQPLLETKLHDLSIIYRYFKNFLKDHYITTEEILDLLSTTISDSEFVRNSKIWIDGFTGFTPIQYKVLSEIIRHSKEVKVTITLESKEGIEDLDPYQLFFNSKKTYTHLIKLAKESKVPILGEEWFRSAIPIRFANQKTLAHLERYLFRPAYCVYEHPPEGLELHIGDHLNQEIDSVARKITQLVREKNYRYQDIAIVTGDLQRYEGPIQKTFGNYGIPYFIDQKKSILANPVIEFIRSTFDIFNHYWSYESVIGWLRTSLCQISQEYVDLIENYALAYGIKGKKKWIQKWDKPYPGQYKDELVLIDMDILNALKDKVMGPFVVFSDKIQGKKTKVKEITIALYYFIQAFEIEKQVMLYVDKFSKEENLLLERQYKQIYKIVMDLLDKVVEILGEEEVSVKEYSLILDAGLEQAQMGLVPPGLDQVVIGDIERTRLKDIKALFLIGANEGIIPKANIKGAILTDRDRELLLEKGVHLAPTAKQKTYEEQFNLYLSLTKPQEYLFVSLSKVDGDYKSIRPSSLVNQIMKLFPKLDPTIDEEGASIDCIGLPKSTMYYLVREIRNYKTKDLAPLWKEVFSWYVKEPMWKDKIQLLIQGLFHQNNGHYLQRETAKRLYGQHLQNSVSRIEQYASCPFSHFIKYGLKVNERIMYEISVPDIGILFHEAIERFSKKLVIRGLEWSELDDDLRDQLVEEAVIEVASDYGNHIFFSSSKNEYLIKRVTRIAKRTLWALQKHIQSGAFKPSSYEVSFSSQREELESLRIQFSDEHLLQLTGRIDRIDTYETEDAVYLKVMDYKSGQKTFDLVAVYYGLQLQLLVYMNAALELEKANTTKEVVPAGIFYYHIDDPMLTVEEKLSDEDREEEILKKLKMDGLVLEDMDIIQLLDKNMTNQSNIIPVKIKKDGALASGSSVASKERFSDLSKYIHKKMVDLGEELVKGNVNIEPYAYKKKTACDYCPYGSVCQFDPSLPEHTYKTLNNLSEENLWKAIGEKAKE